MKILIIEDEKLAAEKLTKTLSNISSDINILKITNSVETSIDWLNNNDQPDIILSDIQLADGLCFNIFSNVNISCPIIFTTAYDKYAIQAFEVNSIDYLLKPVQQDKLQTALKKYQSLKKQSTIDRTKLFEEFKDIISKKTKEYKSRFLCKLGNSIKSVPVQTIRYFYSKEKMNFIIDDNKNRLPINNTLDEIDQMLDPSDFFRVNRQYIIKFDALEEIHPYFKGRLKLKLSPSAEDDIIVSSEKSPLFKSWLNG